ncbi:MAG TPA: hypothetical protein DEO70_12285 [Bacteroidales bacterium]|nr:MAG: hypothetical protein A2X11_13010 [Bacteroidetes bacterium GWE2_42_24]OFY25327.1 MAG: hypothetical protein A2X09_10210 [Bacteroidetes bacterium GWF2_43_11]HBZ67607.1 hypothetical protein [Bacteroidales bacterium]
MGARFREYMAAQGTNRRRHGLAGANLATIPLEIEIQNVVTRDELPQLNDELLKQFNSEVKQWGTSVLQELRYNIPEMGIEGTELTDSLRTNFRKNAGGINRIGFSFRPHGVYIHKGVGRGYQMQGGVVVRTAKGEPKPQERYPKPWFNPVIEAFINDLNQIVGKYYATAVMNTVRIYIP